MKLNKVNVSIGIALIGITYLIVNKMRKKKLLNEVIKSVQSDENITGTGQDLGGAEYMDSNYYKKLVSQYGAENVATSTFEKIDKWFVGQLHSELDKTNVEQFLSELYRVTKSYIIIGSVNKNGPRFIDNIPIFKNELNEYNINEYSIEDWRKLFPNMKLFHSIYTNGNWEMLKDVTNLGISNYVIIEL